MASCDMTSEEYAKKTNPELLSNTRPGPDAALMVAVANASPSNGTPRGDSPSPSAGAEVPGKASDAGEPSTLRFGAVIDYRWSDYTESNWWRVSFGCSWLLTDVPGGHWVAAADTPKVATHRGEPEGSGGKGYWFKTRRAALAALELAMEPPGYAASDAAVRPDPYDGGCEQDARNKTGGLSEPEMAYLEGEADKLAAATTEAIMDGHGIGTTTPGGRDVQADAQWLIDHPGMTMGASYHDSGACWTLIEEFRRRLTKPPEGAAEPKCVMCTRDTDGGYVKASDPLCDFHRAFVDSTILNSGTRASGAVPAAAPAPELAAVMLGLSEANDRLCKLDHELGRQLGLSQAISIVDDLCGTNRDLARSLRIALLASKLEQVPKTIECRA